MCTYYTAPNQGYSRTVVLRTWGTVDVRVMREVGAAQQAIVEGKEGATVREEKATHQPPRKDI